MGANAIVGIDIDYETVGANGSMLMVTTSGTAVVILVERDVLGKTQGFLVVRPSLPTSPPKPDFVVRIRLF